MELRNAEKQIDVLVESYQALVRSKLNPPQTVEQEPPQDHLLPSVGLKEWQLLLSLIPTDDKTKTTSPEIQIATESAISSMKDSGMILTAQQLLKQINDLTDSIEQLEPLTSKFRQRMSMKDPVTNMPRYGDKTMNRVVSLLKKYDALQLAVDIAHGRDHDRGENDNSSSQDREHENAALVHTLERHANSEKALLKEQEEEQEHNLKLQQDLDETRQREEEQRRKQQEFEEELRLKREREELAARAEVARLQRLEQEERAIREAREGERAYLASIPKGKHGVETMLKRLREGCKDKKEMDVALDALYTLFSQIGAHPEEIKFRRVRRDHPKFMEDIGRHDGGKEVLIAAGFIFAEVEGVKCYLSKEPDLASDLDGWSDWFDLIKATTSIIEEEMMK